MSAPVVLAKPKAQKVSRSNRGSLPGEDSDEWRTPLPVLRAIERHLGVHFIADMAADRHNSVCPIYFTREDDTLAMNAGSIRDRIRDSLPAVDPQKHALFCNPPYKATGLAAWIQKGAAVSKWIDLPWVFLLPASRTEQPWMHLRPAHEFNLTLVKHRIAYIRPDGTPGTRPNHPSMVMAFPGENRRILGGRFSLLNREKEGT
ncbi:MAG: DNA N-6-adenine-methyltransferase [Fibrobacteria bacterium]